MVIATASEMTQIVRIRACPDSLLFGRIGNPVIVLADVLAEESCLENPVPAGAHIEEVDVCQIATRQLPAWRRGKCQSCCVHQKEIEPRLAANCFKGNDRLAES